MTRHAVAPLVAALALALAMPAPAADFAALKRQLVELRDAQARIATR